MTDSLKSISAHPTESLEKVLDYLRESEDKKKEYIYEHVQIVEELIGKLKVTANAYGHTILVGDIINTLSKEELEMVFDDLFQTLLQEGKIE